MEPTSNTNLSTAPVTQNSHTIIDINDESRIREERTNLVAQPALSRRLTSDEMDAILDELPSTWTITCGIFGIVATITALGIKYFASGEVS